MAVAAALAAFLGPESAQRTAIRVDIRRRGAGRHRRGFFVDSRAAGLAGRAGATAHRAAAAAFEDRAGGVWASIAVAEWSVYFLDWVKPEITRRRRSRGAIWRRWWAARCRARIPGDAGGHRVAVATARRRWIVGAQTAMARAIVLAGDVGFYLGHVGGDHGRPIGIRREPSPCVAVRHGLDSAGGCHLCHLRLAIRQEGELRRLSR